MSETPQAGPPRDEAGARGQAPDTPPGKTAAADGQGASDGRHASDDGRHKSDDGRQGSDEEAPGETGNRRAHPTASRPLPPRALVRRRAKRIGWVVLVVLLVGASWTVYGNLRSRHRTAHVSEQNSRQFVTVVRATRQGGGGDVVLPATLRGYVESPIYARASGYLLRRYVDIGARVAQGQLLAVLDTPEIDQEWAQAIAQRQQTAAALGLAKTSAERWQQLRQRDAVSQQELDDRMGSYRQSQANQAAADANVQRLAQLRAFKRIVAPFAGVVTQRNVDVGDLITAGNAGTGRAMFVLAQSDPLRVYVSVPQAYSTHVALGQPVTVRQAELPGTVFTGTITHTSAAIDVPTRSLQIEVTLPNRDGRLLPGAYVQVSLPHAAGGRWVVPGNTLLFRAEGPQLATVTTGNRVHLLPVVIAQDTGKALEIDSGVQASDRIIVNPGDALEEGDAVTIAPPKAASKAAPDAASGAAPAGASHAAANAGADAGADADAGAGAASGASAAKSASAARGDAA